MKATYNVTGAARKELVKVIGSTLGTKPVYKFMPTCAFEIGAITVEKDGTMVWDERTDEATIQAVIAALAAAGFTAEIEGEAAPETEGLQEAAHEAEDAEETDGAEEGDRLTIALPKDGFTDGSIENLRKLVESKATLIKKALGADRITIDTDGDLHREPAEAGRIESHPDQEGARRRPDHHRHGRRPRELPLVGQAAGIRRNPELHGLPRRPLQDGQGSQAGHCQGD